MLTRKLMPYLASMFLCANAFADSPDVRARGLPELPRVFAARLTTEHNWMWVDCTPTTTHAPYEATCMIRQTWLRTPRQDTAGVDAVKKLGTQPWGTEHIKSCEQERVSVIYAPMLVARRNRVLEACQLRDAKAYSDIILQDLTREAETCSMFMPLPYSLEFRQVDANTWVNLSHEGNAGFCVATTTTTLWRPSSNARLWNVSTSRDVPPNASPQCRQLLAHQRRDWTFYDHDQLTLPCRYIGP